jgi:tetratricopeptide (TPR) repeat protein
LGKIIVTSQKKNKRKSRTKKGGKSIPDLDVAAVNQHDASGDNIAESQATNNRVTRLNQRLVLLVALCSFALVGGMHGVRHFQLERNAKIYLNRATSLQEEGKSNEAIVYLSRYLRFRPDDVDALANLGKLVKESHQNRRGWQHVFLTFEEVVSRDPGRSDIRRELVEVAVKLGRYGSALDHLVILRKDASDDGELAFLSAVCHHAEDHFEKAVEDYSKSIEQSHSAIDHYVGFALFVAREFDGLSIAGREIVLKAFGHLLERPTHSDGPDNQETSPELNAFIVVDSLLDLMGNRSHPGNAAIIVI